MLVVIYMVCRQAKLKALVANIALKHAKGIEAADMTDRYCIYKTNWYNVGMLLIIMIGIIYQVRVLFDTQTFLALYLLKEKIRLLCNSYKANEKYIFGNGGIPPDVHVHEHLLNKRMMHMQMHIP